MLFFPYNYGLVAHAYDAMRGGDRGQESLVSLASEHRTGTQALTVCFVQLHQRPYVHR